MAGSVNNHVLPETTSTCLAQNITGAHNFVVTNFSQLDGMGIGKYVSSGTFTIGGCSWNVNFYPDGESDTKAEYSSVYYRFLEGPEGTRIKTSLSLFDRYDRAVTKQKGKKKRNGKGKKVLELQSGAQDGAGLHLSRNRVYASWSRPPTTALQSGSS